MKFSAVRAGRFPVTRRGSFRRRSARDQHTDREHWAGSSGRWVTNRRATTRGFGGVIVDLFERLAKPSGPFEASPNHNHCKPRPAGAESSVWKTEKAADKRVTRCSSGIRLDWSGNRTGNSVCRGSSIRTGERVDCSPVSLHVSKPSLRANYFKVPVGLPGNGRFWCVIQSTVQQPADFTAGPAGLEPATRPL